MTTQALRVMSFYGMHLVYFPLLIASLHLLTHLQKLNGPWPGWLTTVISLAMAASLYVSLGYGVTRWLRLSGGRR